MANYKDYSTSIPGLEVIKLYFMLHSADHEFFLAHKCLNANNWHFNINEQENSVVGPSEPEKCCIS